MWQSQGQRSPCSPLPPGAEKALQTRELGHESPEVPPWSVVPLLVGRCDAGTHPWNKSHERSPGRFIFITRTWDVSGDVKREGTSLENGLPPSVPQMGTGRHWGCPSLALLGDTLSQSCR